MSPLQARNNGCPRLAIAMLSIAGAWGRRHIGELVCQHSDISSYGCSFVVANLLGSFALGALVSSDHQSVAYGSGFCGSLTSFSAWVFAYSFDLVHGDIWEFIVVFFSGLLLSWTSYRVGAYVTYYPWVHGIVPLAVIVCTVVNSMINWTPCWEDMLVLLFAPAGAHLRIWFSNQLNKNHFQLPFGTLAASGIGTILSVLLWYSGEKTWIPAGFVYASRSYFCGSLSTMSTFIHELDSNVNAVHYLILSVVLCTTPCIVVISGV